MSFILPLFTQLAQVHLSLQGHLKAAGVHQLQLQPQAWWRGWKITAVSTSVDTGGQCISQIWIDAGDRGCLLSVKLWVRIANPFLSRLRWRQLRNVRTKTTNTGQQHIKPVRKRSVEECVYLCDPGWVWRCRGLAADMCPYPDQPGLAHS